MRSLLIPLLFALSLPACRPAEDQAATGEAIAEGAGVGDTPTGRSGDPVAKEAQNSAIPANIDEGVEPPRARTTTPASPTNIPSDFPGRWALVPADCEPGRSDAKGLLRIDENRLYFYESRGTLERIDANSPPNRLVANFGFSGEGMTWSRLVTLERSGDKLRRLEPASAEEPAVDLTYTACPA